MTVRRSGSGKLLPLFVRGLAAAQVRSSEAESSVAALRAIRQGDDNAYRAKRPEVMELEVAALAASLRGDHSAAIELMQKATRIEDEMAPPSGPPSLVKPSHELFGEVLLRAGRAREAAEQFATALLRQPNRARSLLGAARAAAASGDSKSAAGFYAKFLSQWEHADRHLQEISEAGSYLKQARGQ